MCDKSQAFPFTFERVFDKIVVKEVDGMSQLLEKMQECVQDVYTQARSSVGEIDWSNTSAETVERFLAATTYRNHVNNLVKLISQEEPSFSAEQLSVEYLEDGSGARYLRRASQAVASSTGIRPQQAKQQLLKAVVLHRHGQSILQQLEHGLISVFHADDAAASALSFKPPEVATPEDRESPEHLQICTEIDEARTLHCEELAEAATEFPSQANFKRHARKKREEHHPVSVNERARSAAAKRSIKFSPLPDQMAKIEIFAPSHTAVMLEHVLLTLCRSLRASGQADDRSRNQLMVDVFTDLMVDNPHLTQLMEAAKTKIAATGASEGNLLEEFGAGDDGVDATGLERLPQGVGSHIILQVTMEEYVRLGGLLDGELEEQLATVNRELYELAVQNRKESETALRSRRRRKVPDNVESLVRVVGSDQDLSPQAAADLIELSAEMSLVLTDTVTGYPLGVGRRTHSAGKKLRLLLSLRDQHCRAPGCRKSVHECELDHVEQWARDNGRTDYSNLAYLCRDHHQHKSNGWLTVKARPDLGDGVLDFEDNFQGKASRTFPQWPLAPRAWAKHQAHLERQQQPPF